MVPKKKTPATGELLISVAEFNRTRDHVLGSLHSLQNGLVNVQHQITVLMDHYNKHCASVLGIEKDDVSTENDAITSTIKTAANVVESGQKLMDSVAGDVGAPAEKAIDGVKSKKRKREKKEKDPNAPKKPLTAAFLYHQHARPIVKADLEAALAPGGTLAPAAVQTEVNRRWAELSDAEKEVSTQSPNPTIDISLTQPQEWKASYRNSMEEWKVQMAEYVKQKGIKDAEIEEDDASEEGEPEIEAEVEAGAADSDASSEDEDEAPAKAPSPPAKTPRKRQKTTPAVNGNSIPVSIAPATASTPVPLPTSRSAPQATTSTAPAVAETPAKKDKKKKEKSAPQPIAPAPASSHDEPTPPEETGAAKKKAKSGRSTRNTEMEGDKENAAAAQEKEKADKAGKEKKRDRSKRKSEVASS
ncbi:hypothetical protein J4E89_008612 [Alternaria sp. Ai002NY15]|nr:hypothetical protein J4E89_008612 [Alternaria sp. Ai002NY15]